MPKKEIPYGRALDRSVTVRFDLVTYSQLNQYAIDEGFTPSLVVRHLVKRFLENQRRLKIDTLRGIAS